MKNSTKVLSVMLAFTLVGAVMFFTVSSDSLKGLLKFTTKAVEVRSPVEPSCPVGSLVFDSKFSSTAKYKNFSSLYDAVKNGTVSNCIYSVFVGAKGAGENENIDSTVVCKNGLSLTTSTDSTYKLLSCQSDKAVVQLTEAGANVKYDIDGSANISVSSAHYSVTYK